VITDAADRYEVDLEGYKVMECAADLAFTLELAGRNQRVTVRLTGTFSLTRGGETYRLDAESRPHELGPALELSRTSVRKAVVRKTGELEMEFSDGSNLRVMSDPDYEAWTLTFTNGPIIVSGPGGKLTLFGSPKRPMSASN
jgi:hypothetical protein